MSESLKHSVEYYFDVVPHRSTSEELVIVCPQCSDKSGNRSINLNSALTNCWRCGGQPGHSGDFYRWAKSLGYDIEREEVPVDDDELMELTEKIGGGRKKVREGFSTGVKLPEGFTLLKDDPDSYYYKKIAKMAKRKNLHIKDFIKAGAGFTRQDHRWEPYAIFPVTEWERVVYYQGRTYTDVPGKVTKKFPSRYDLELGSRYWVYGIDEARKHESVSIIIVEAIFNVLSLRKVIKERGIENVVPVAIFKHAVSHEQAKKIAKIRGLKEICLMFDEDSIIDSWNAVRKIARISSDKFTVVEMPKDPETGKGIDPNDDAELAMDLWEKRKPAGGTSGLTGELNAQLNKLTSKIRS